MSAVCAPEPQPRSHSRSLSSLCTRSLRDLRAKVQPSSRIPTPEQFRRRVLQVNGLYPVQQPCPPSAAIGASCRAEAVQASSSSIHSQPSSMNISPFIAAKRASFEDVQHPIPHPYPTSTTNLNVATRGNGQDNQHRPVPTRSMTYSEAGSTTERRDPPVDPRKSRRYCSDFGLGRAAGSKPPIPSLPSPSPPVPDDSSMLSTPPAMYADTETDSDTSSEDHQLELSFPQPPPIDQSFRLRRMHSSPMFSSEETEAVKDFLRRRWGAKPQASIKHIPEALPIHGDHLEATGFSKDSILEMEGESLISLDFPSVRRATKRPMGICLPPPPKNYQFRNELLPATATPNSEVSSATSRFSSSLRRSQGVSWKRETSMTPNPRGNGQGSKAESAHLSHPSPAPSSRKGHITLPTSVSHTNLRATNESSSERSLPLSNAPSEPLNRLNLSIQKLKSYDPHQRQGDRDRFAAVPWEYQLDVKPLPSPAVLSPPSLASAGRKKPTHRSHVSVPLAGLGFVRVNTSTSGAPNGLGAPFHHRATRSQPMVCVPTHNEPIPKSFIDITPEQESRHVSSSSRAGKERMRKLLARASNGVLGWGKSLGRKGVGSK
ncbi:hypothetical protein Hypma_002674 [Hypsizygus marmoreus]|uniref:Uncharacterized protein n=1 Tax=Hypsizygus marmoreus TaxID=39966 RepID=A0A369J980_HYPMA|nr:hypothetical protein Hypma_002674 [Hypsizygus marmoreus]